MNRIRKRRGTRVARAWVARACRDESTRGPLSPSATFGGHGSYLRISRLLRLRTATGGSDPKPKFEGVQRTLFRAVAHGLGDL
jgi:hypothetical protein